MVATLSFKEHFGSKVLHLVKQKTIYPYEYMSGFEKFKEELLGKEKFFISLTDKNIIDNEYEDALKVWNTFQMRR